VVRPGWAEPVFIDRDMWEIKIVLNWMEQRVQSSPRRAKIEGKNRGARTGKRGLTLREHGCRGNSPGGKSGGFLKVSTGSGTSPPPRSNA